jgi:hypothetical protein
MQNIFKIPATGLQRFQKGSLVHGVQDSLRLFLGHPNRPTIVNQKEIRILGLRRTGNHAIIQ